MRLLLLLLPFLAAAAAGKANFKKEYYDLQPKVGDACKGRDYEAYPHYPDPEDKFAFLTCHPQKDIFHKVLCPQMMRKSKDKYSEKANRDMKIFDDVSRTCRYANFFKQYAVGSAKFGENCDYNTDCLEGMWCSGGTCQCQSNYVDVGGTYCYAKINPSQTGCSQDEQCSAVWPQATCVTNSGSSTGVCTCPTATPTAVQTKDGWVCVQNVAGVCALPPPATTVQNTGALSALYVEGSANLVTGCNIQAQTGCNVAAGTDLNQLYDCVTDGSTAKTPICCASKAAICAMPIVSGVAGSGVQTPRWWYNSVSGTCEQFQWEAATTAGAGNGNNFLTMTQCQSFCQDTCTRGRPQYETTNTNNLANGPLSCSSATPCDSNHQCDSIGSLQYCCSTPTYICSKNGGITARTGLPNNYEDGFFEQTLTATTLRWYYDEDNAKCQTFNYKGIGGNFNNFASQSDCRDYCEKLLCDRGSPIKDSAGENLACSSSSGCPSSYTCTNSVCCPRTQTVCAQPKQIGTCGRYVNRYWYNAITGECENFVFSGCQGNDNNFESLISCQNYCRNTRPEPQCIQGSAYKDSNGNFYVCSNSGIGNACPANYECYYDGFVWGCCPTQTYSCSLTSNSGATCGPQTVRWYYDTTTKSCQTFSYLGCNGNSNNFPTRNMCEAFCGVGGCPNGGEPYRASADNSRVICSAAVTCPTDYECTPVYTAGNQANVCCPTKAFICSSPPNQVQTCSGTSPLTRYFYNIASRSCTQFQYYACDTNLGVSNNNFATLAQCLDFCSSSACPAGTVIYTDPNNDRPLTCNSRLQNSCPLNYKCTYDSLTGNNVCCGASDMGVCPSTEKAYMDPRTLKARECTPNVAGTCYLNYLCRFNVKLAKYYCCLPDDFCPPGKAVFRDSNLNNRPQSCALSSVVNACSSDYSCQAAFNASTTTTYSGFCCTNQPVCLNGGSFDLDANTQNPRRCIIRQNGVGNSGCSSGFNCLPVSENSTTGNCCTGTADVCGLNANQKPFLVNGRPQMCNARAVGTGTGCGVGYICQLYTPTNTYFCCSQANDGCPAGYSVRTSAQNNPVICNARNIVSCPVGDICYQTTQFSRSQCCMPNAQVTQSTQDFGDGCPLGMVGFRAGAGVQQCSSGADQSCPIGYPCQYSSNGRYQCCGLRNGCPIGQVAQVDPTTGYAQSCLAQGSFGQCRTGFTCTVSSTGGYTCCGGGQSVNQNPTPSTGPLCPNPAQRTPANAAQVNCSPTTGNVCPSGYSCTYSNTGRRYVCCGSGAPAPSLRQCRAGSEYFYNNALRLPLDCGPFRDNCPAGNFCSFSNQYAAYVCCSSFQRLREPAPFDRAEFDRRQAKQRMKQPNESDSSQPPPGQNYQRIVTAEVKVVCDKDQEKNVFDECCDDAQCMWKCAEWKHQRRCICGPGKLVSLKDRNFPMCVDRANCERASGLVQDGPFCVNAGDSFHQADFPEPKLSSDDDDSQ